MSTSALEGLKILEFGVVGAGPLATKDLADNGATVIKVESTKHLDLTRRTPPFKNGTVDANKSGFFVWTNSSKYSVTLNLHHPDCKAVVKRLIAWADVLLENMAYGFMDKIGLDYDNIKKINRDIIMVSVSITGRTGSHAHFKGYGNSGAALSGHASLTGWSDRAPLLSPIAFSDVITPRIAVASILAALDHRNRTGKGQYIDISQVETMANCLSPAILHYFSDGHKDTRIGNRSPQGAPHGVFPCEGNDQWCAVAVLNDQQWASLCKVIGRMDLINSPDFKTFTDRKKNEDELEKMVSEWTKGQTKEHVMKTLQEAGIPVGIVQDQEDLAKDTHLIDRQTYKKLDHSVIGPCNHAAPPIKLSKTPAEMRPAPILGEHNHRVYTQFLGISDQKFVDLLNSGVFD